MIHTNRIVTVGEQESIIDRPIVLYRGDREVEIEFTLVGNEFTFSKEGNVIKSVNASHGQLVLNTPSGEHMFSELAECNEGKVVFVVTKEMIDEFIEMGFYSFQIRLYDSAEMKSRVTIPPVMSGFDIRNPIAAEDEANAVNQAIVEYARIFKDRSDEELPTFDWQDNYNKTEWAHHDVITENKLNKIEDALYSINANVKESDVVMLNTLDQVKKDADKYVKEHMAEVEQDVEDFEREMNYNFNLLKIDTNSFETNMTNSFDRFKVDVNSQLEYAIDHVSVNEFGAMGDGIHDDTKALQSALNFARENSHSTVYVPKGIYMISDSLSIFSNTHLLLDKSATIKRIKNGDMLLNGIKGGTEQHSNITIEGGTWDMDNNHTTYMGGVHFTIGNCKNIAIKNVRFLNNHGNHCLDMAGIDNLLIENCSFEGVWIDPSGARDYVEAIQLSDFTAAGQPVFNGVFNDKPCKNVVINNCIFNDSDNSNYGYWSTGIGHHGNNSIEDVTENVSIKNCKFYGCTVYGIRPYSYKNVLIDGCYFEQCEEAIHITNIGRGENADYAGCKPSMNININNCTFVKSGLYDICCCGKLHVDDIEDNKYIGYGQDIKIHNCTFINSTNTNSNCIFLEYVKGCNIKSCYFENITRPIFYKACTDLNITNNITYGSKSEYIYSSYKTVASVNLFSHNVNISNNIIDGCNKNGIFIQYTDSFIASNNLITNCSTESATRGGLLVSSKSKNGCVIGNCINGINHAYDISIDNTCSGVIVANNVCATLQDNQS